MPCRRDLRHLLTKVAQHPSVTEEETIVRTRISLAANLEVWLERSSKILAPYTSLPDHTVISNATSDPSDVENIALTLPSYLPAEASKAIPVFWEAETKLREGAAYEAARMAVIMADALRKLASDKVIHGEEIAETMARMLAGIATKSTTALRQLESERDKAIADWNAHRSALERLGTLNNSMLQGLPEMTRNDTFRTRSVDGPRLPGDSHIHEQAGYQHVRAMATQSMASRAGGEGEQSRMPNAERGQKRIEVDMAPGGKRARSSVGAESGMNLCQLTVICC